METIARAKTLTGLSIIILILATILLGVFLDYLANIITAGSVRP